MAPLAKMRRGRKLAGTVKSLATDLGVLAAVEAAIANMSVSKQKRILACQVHKGPLGSAGGYAFPPRPARPNGLIELHNGLFDTFKDELENVFMHELGHIIDSYERNKTDHGPRWKGVMKRLGRPNETRCHDMVELRYYGRHKVSCSKCGFVVPSAKPTKTCDWCNSTMRPVHQNSMVIKLNKKLMALV